MGDISLFSAITFQAVYYGSLVKNSNIGRNILASTCCGVSANSGVTLSLVSWVGIVSWFGGVGTVGSVGWFGGVCGVDNSWNSVVQFSATIASKDPCFSSVVGCDIGTFAC